MTDNKKTERALFLYGLQTESEYMQKIPLEFDVDDSERDQLGDYLFDICDYFGLPMTNSPDVNHDLVDMGDFITAIRGALDAAGWVSKRQHEQELEQTRHLID